MISGQDPLLFDELPFWSAPFGIALLETARIRTGLKVLDIGSGGGFPMLELASRLDHSSMVTGLDPSPEYNGLVRKKIAAKDIPNARVVEGYAEKMPFTDNSFDLVTSNNGLNNVGDLTASLRESFRVLMPGGQMVFTMNLPGTFTEFYNIFEGLLDELSLEESKIKLKEHIFEKRKPVEHIRDLVLETGFGIRSIQPEGFKYRFADGTSFFNHYLIRNFFLPSWQKIVPEQKVSEIFARLELKLNNAASDTGYLELSVPFIIFDLFKSKF